MYGFGERRESALRRHAPVPRFWVGKLRRAWCLRPVHGGWALQPRLAYLKSPPAEAFSLSIIPRARAGFTWCYAETGTGWCYSGGGDGESEGGDTASLAADTFSPFALPLPLSRAVVAAASHGSRALFVRTENGLHT